jgi:hypothetical protein
MAGEYTEGRMSNNAVEIIYGNARDRNANENSNKRNNDEDDGDARGRVTHTWRCP